MFEEKGEILQKILEQLYEAIIDGDKDDSVGLVQKALDKDMKALSIIDECLTPAITEVGERFNRLEVFLPEMIITAEAMQAAVAVLEPHFSSDESRDKGTVVLGTVKGDIHDIGKSILKAMLDANGFNVIDAGRDVDIEKFFNLAEDKDADMIAMSGLLSTSIPVMKEMIEFLNDEECRDKYKVIIGGGPTSQELADEIEADGYGDTAFDAIKICETLLG